MKRWEYGAEAYRTTTQPIRSTNVALAANVLQLTEVAALRTSELKTNACSSRFC